MIHDDLDILQIFDEVNIKRITLIQGLMVYINVPTVTSYSSDELGALTTGGRCPLGLLPEKDFLQSVASLSPLSGPDLESQLIRKAFPNDFL